MVKKPWEAKQKLLEAMELRLDAAIDKTENLARDVEINHMMKKFDSLMEKAHTEQVISMVAEPNTQYGAEVFEEYEKEKGNCESVPETTYSKTKNDGKSRQEEPMTDKKQDMSSEEKLFWSYFMNDKGELWNTITSVSSVRVIASRVLGLVR